MYELIAASAIVAALLQSGWEPVSAEHIAGTYPAICNTDARISRATRFWPWPSPYLNRPHFEFYDCTPGQWLIDHEAQHAAYFEADGGVYDEKLLRAAFWPLRDSAYPRTAECARQVTSPDRSISYDVPHWNHALLACLNRDKRLVPPEYAEKYLSWLRLRYFVRFPLVSRPAAARSP